MIAYQLLTSCFVLTAYGSDFGPPGICSAPEVPTNVCAYQTPQSTAKVTVGLTRFDGHPVSPDRPRSYPQEASNPLFRLATTPRSPPLFTDYIADVDPNLFTDHADPPPATRSSYDKPVLAGNLFCPLVSHRPGTSDMKDFTETRLTKMLTPGQNAFGFSSPKIISPKTCVKTALN
jgi:hypothetical protein